MTRPTRAAHIACIAGVQGSSMSNTDASSETDTQPRGESTSDETKPQPADRQQLINLAVRFLNNPRVVNSPADQKRAFLKKKGLTDEEIDIAVRQSSINSLPPHSSPAPNSVPPGRPPQYDVVPHQYHPPPTPWRSYLFRGVVFGGVVWIVVRLVRKFLNRWQVQQELQMQQRWQEMHTSIQQLQASINSTVTCINETTQTLKDLLTEQHQQIQLLSSQVSTLEPHTGDTSLSEIQQELDILKGLMLNRHQFSTPQKGSSSPSIPNWQRSSLTTDSSMTQQSHSPPKGNELPAPALSTSAEEEEKGEESDSEGKGLPNDQPLLTDKEAND